MCVCRKAAAAFCLPQGESLQKWAEVHLRAVRSAPLSPAIRQQEEEAKQFSAVLCQQVGAPSLR